MTLVSIHSCSKVSNIFHLLRKTNPRVGNNPQNTQIGKPSKLFQVQISGIGGLPISGEKMIRKRKSYSSVLLNNNQQPRHLKLMNNEHVIMLCCKV